MEDLATHIDAALGTMSATGPRDLRAYLAQPGPDFVKASRAEVDAMISLILSKDPNGPARIRFSDLIRSWDNLKVSSWSDGTPRNTGPRRRRIHQLLKSDAELVKQIDAVLPFYPLEEPLIIATEHADWYAPTPGRDYYWSAYTRYLKAQRFWGEISLLALDNSTRAVLECLANPESKTAYSSRGLVMGYVQSGKTANFTGVVARAADAGYRFIIVLAGSWNILRNQTQRRLDKELLGKELLANDEYYLQNNPPDWPEFLEHGFDPVQRGYYTWQRLTRPEIDLRRLKAAIDNLEFERRNKALPIYNPENLHALPVKLLVVKKHSGILNGLVKDLGLLRTRLTDLPALIIDDESDQAGINTIDPRRSVSPGAERTATNKAIVELLKLLPRGQYVGYTATPYANALVNPDDVEDLFPRDFIISLERPAGYMGVSDFFDPTTDYDDLIKDDFEQPEIAFIRRVENPQGQDGEDLRKALTSYVLAGGIKLFREAKDPTRYRPDQFKHHTMLIHTSHSKGDHASLAAEVRAVWDRCVFNSPQGLKELNTLWKEDFTKVSRVQGQDEVNPKEFSSLKPYLAEAMQRIVQDPHFIRVVNSDKDEAPDFSAGPVWKIVIGGNKLSRGYTIEGLTISYYRRSSTTGDTLMQMGRWFGFRPGYRDLVRVFLGVNEGRNGDVDLVSSFKEVCRMEERFRDEIKRYLRQPSAPRITPKQIPPLIAVSGNLPPTARNKMFNAVLTSKNFGGTWSMPTLAAAKRPDMQSNMEALQQLIGASNGIGKKVLGGSANDGAKISAEWVLFEASNANIIKFLLSYHWLESDYKYPSRPADIGLQAEFLEKQKHGIESWLVMAPQRRSSFGEPMVLDGNGKLTVKMRSRLDGRGFRVMGESAHRVVAEYLTDIDPGKETLASPNSATSGLQSTHRGIMLLYPVREIETGAVSIGFELLFPNNKLPFEAHFTVLKKGELAAAVQPVRP